ncbi:MAG TPA: GNAT family N-acetyltransferase [Terrimicrobiaceae bacterium]
MPTLFEIETDRLLLRRLKVEDAPDYHALETDEDVKRFLSRPSRLTVQDYADSIEKGVPGLATMLAVTLKKTGEFLGRCGFTYNDFLDGWEINIVLHRRYWGYGYASEIGSSLISRGFDLLGCQIVYGVVDAQNTASIHLCEKIGLVRQPNVQFSRDGRPAQVYATKQSQSSGNPARHPG